MDEHGQEQDNHEHHGHYDHPKGKRTRPRHRPRTGESAGFMTRDELLQTDPIPATERLPDDLIREFIDDDEIVLGGERRLIPFDELPHSERHESSGFRPPWLAQNFIGRAAGRPLSRAALDAARYGVLLPPRLLDYHPDKELFDRSYPWSTIGRVFIGTDPRATSTTWHNLYDSSGTGFMVGPRIMVTASHLAPWDPENWWMRFVPSYWGNIAGTAFTQPYGSAWVDEFVGVPHDDSEVTGEDLVVCRLSKRLGDVTGWLARWRFFNDDSYKDWPYTSVGYPGIPYGGERPVLQPFIAVEDVDDDGQGKELETMPFTAAGWSGGPLFFWRGQQPYAVGVDSGREEEFDFWAGFIATHSVFSGGRRFTDLIDQAEREWP